MLGSNAIRVKSWKEFKLLIDEQKPEFVAYVIEQSQSSSEKEPVMLRFIFPGTNVQYVFSDFPKGNALQETDIPLHKNESGNNLIEENDIKDFLKKQLKHKCIICAY